jgi:hypothetical protein
MPATIFWTGTQSTRRQVDVRTVNASVGAVYTYTVNNKAFTYTAVTGDTADSVAAGLAAAGAASVEPQHKEMTFTSSGATVIATGPADGASFGASSAASGSGTFTSTSTISALSPHNLGDTANHSGGAFPANGDTFIIRAGTPAIKYNLDALALITGLIIRREVKGGRVGLPTLRPDGRQEYRKTRMETLAASITLYTDGTDVKESLRFDCLGEPTAVEIVGQAAGQLGAEVVEIVGQATTAKVFVTASSVALATKDAGTGAIQFITAVNSTLRVGPWGGTVTHLEVFGGSAQTELPFTKLTADNGAQVRVLGTATGQPIVDGGRVSWVGSGALVNPIIGSDGELTVDEGIAAIAVTGKVTRQDRGRFSDANGRITRPYDFEFNRSANEGAECNFGTHFLATIDDV